MLAKIIDIYNKQPRKGSFIEFEIRSTLDAASYKKYTDAISGRSKAEYSINFINNTILNRAQNKSDQYIRKITFDSATLAKVSETYYKKTRLSPPFSMRDLKVVVSEERPTENFAVNLNAMVRFKKRHSLEHTFAGKKWTLDITATQTFVFDEIKDRIVELKNAFFKAGGTNPDSGNKVTYEFEIEYADTAIITISDIDGEENIITEIYNIVDSTFKSRNGVASQIRNITYAIKGADRKAETVKAATNQVVALTKNTYYRELYPPVGYYITEKLDGTRALVKVAAKKCYIITNTVETHALPETSASASAAAALTIVDAEYANGVVYVFDVLVLNGADITSLPFKQRYERIAEAVKVISAYVPCESKQFVVLDAKNMESAIKKVFNAEYEYAIDGIIFTSPDEDYYGTKNYKWKPSEDNTIDFLVKRSGDYYLLFVGISRAAFEKFGIIHLSAYNELFPSPPSNYFPVHFCPSLNPCAFIYRGDAKDIDGKIVEFVLTDKGEWDAVRVRTDRTAGDGYFGNDFKVAETIYSNYLDKFELRDLYTAPNTYFRESAESVYRAANHYRRQITDDLIKTYFSNKKTIIDEACGRGADIRRYVVNKIQNVLFIDVDATAVTELISRKYSLIKNTDVKSSINVFALIANLNDPHKKVAEKIANAKFCLDAANGILCNFAFHYMAGSVSSIKNLLTLNYNLMAPESYFVFTTFDGAKVFELLKGKKINDAWTLVENNRVKYSITKKFMGDKMAESGQVIGVMLPFSNETYDEYLVNFTTVAKIAEDVGFKVILNKSFGDFELNARGEPMSEADIEYNKLYSVFIVQKK